MAGSTNAKIHGPFRPLVAGLVLVVLLGHAHPVHAYIDPGSGSMMLQMLLGGVAGAAVLIKLCWQRVAERLGVRTPPTRSE